MAKGSAASKPRPVEVVGPIGGGANNTTFVKTPSRFCPPPSIQNVRVIGSSRKRLRFSQRPGIARMYSQRMGVGGWDTSGTGSPGQALAVLQAVTGQVGTTRGQLTQITAGTSYDGGPIAGTLWIIDGSNATLIDGVANPDSPVAGQLYIGGFYVGWHATNPALVGWGNLCFDTTAGNQAYASIHLYNATTRAQVWQSFLKDWDPTSPATQSGGAVGARSIVPNSVRVYGTYTYVSAGPYIYVFRTSDGYFLKRVTPSDWSDEVQDVRQVGSSLYALFTGSSVVAGIIPADTSNVHEGQFVRAGVAKFTVNADTGNASPDPLTHIAWAQTITNTDPNYENHQTFRFSEKLRRGLGTPGNTAPRGCLPFGFAVGSDGSIFASYTNRGWGKTVATDFPDSSFAPTTVCKISSAGVLMWEADTLSILDQYVQAGNVMYNDIPGGGDLVREYPSGLASKDGPGGDETSIVSLAVDAAGDVYAAGHRNQVDATGGSTFNVFKLSGIDGTILWAFRISGMVYQHCLAIDPTDGNLVVTGERNSNWDGANADGTGAKQAHLWKLASGTGVVMWHLDLNAAVSGFGVDVNSQGRVAYVTQTV